MSLRKFEFDFSFHLLGFRLYACHQGVGIAAAYLDPRSEHVRSFDLPCTPRDFVEVEMKIREGRLIHLESLRSPVLSVKIR